MRCSAKNLPGHGLKRDARHRAGALPFFLGRHAGAENKLFVNTGCSLVIAPYHDSKQNVIGAIGVLGPRHMNYARIIPMVDYTSRAISAVLS